MFQLTLSESAVNKLRETIAKYGTPETTYVRVYIAGGGCSGYRYGMGLDKEVREGDELVQKDGIKLVVDQDSAKQLDGSSVDYVESVAGSGFVVNNPNAWSTCGCGQSFTPKGEAAPDQTQGHHAHAHSH